MTARSIFSAPSITNWYVMMITEEKDVYNTTDVIEHRARHRLRLHGLRLHKRHNQQGEPVYFLSPLDGDQTTPAPDAPYRWYSLKRLIDYVEELAERDAEYYAERRAGY